MVEPDEQATCGWSLKNLRHVRLPVSLMIAAVIAQPLLPQLARAYPSASPARVALMLTPGLLYAAAALVFALYLRKLCDELLIRLHLQAATVGFVVALVAGFLLNGLTQAGLLRTAAGDGGALGIIAWAIAIFRFSRQYQLGRWAPRDS